MTQQTYPIPAAYQAVKTTLQEPRNPLPIPHDRALGGEQPTFSRKDLWVIESATD